MLILYCSLCKSVLAAGMPETPPLKPDEKPKSPGGHKTTGGYHEGKVLDLPTETWDPETEEPQDLLERLTKDHKGELV